jgi:hypothetical protein
MKKVNNFLLKKVNNFLLKMMTKWRSLKGDIGRSLERLIDSFKKKPVYMSQIT